MTVAPRCVLTIGGSDSSGACGVQADLRTFVSLGAHGASALTILTAQNTEGILAASPVSPDFVRTQVEAVVADYRVAATKTGMLASAQTVQIVAEIASALQLQSLVVDPVLVSGDGRSIFGSDVTEAYRSALLKLAVVATPNRDEAALLCDVDRLDIRDVDSLRQLADELANRFPRVTFLVKGGRLDSEDAVDIVARRGQATTELRGSRVASRNVAGTGDALSAAVAVHLAAGASPTDACSLAKLQVAGAIERGATWQLGRGPGPIDAVRP